MANEKSKAGFTDLITWPVVCEFAQRRVTGKPLTKDDRRLQKAIEANPELLGWYKNARRVYNHELYEQVKRVPRDGPSARGADQVQYFPGKSDAIGLARCSFKATWRRSDSKNWDVQLEFDGTPEIDIREFNGDEFLLVIELRDGTILKEVTLVEHQANESLESLLSIPRRFQIEHPRHVVGMELIPYCRLAQEIANAVE